jgi:hypothetical protein
MPAKSQAQQKAAGAALAAKRGERPRSKLKGASKEMVESMTEQQLDAAQGQAGARPEPALTACPAAHHPSSEASTAPRPAMTYSPM